MFYKVIEENYIVGIGESSAIGDNTEITLEEYNSILEVVRNKPQDTEDTIYKLNVDLEYVPTDRPIEEPTEEVESEEYQRGYEQALLDLAELEGIE